MSWLSNLIYGKDPGQSATGKAYDASTQSAGAAAAGAQAKYAGDNAGFDPEAAFRTSAQGAYGTFATQLGQTLRNLGGKAVAAGRFDSGFYDQDQGQVIRDVSSDFTNNLNTRALDAAGMRLSQIGQEGNYALQQSGQYDDLLSGGLDRETAQQNAKRQQRSSFWSGLFDLGGQAAGAAAAAGHI